MSHIGVTEVGKYRIVDQIGEGAMGVVYRATDLVLNRTVAIKVMSETLARDDELRSRFLREAQAAGSLQHPNVVTIYDFGEVGGHLFIAMEFVAGDDLESILTRQQPLSVVQKIDVLINVLSGLGYAHKRGIVHRDIKPANIRIDEEGRARIMDFGIAHLQSSKLTRTGLMVGTPAYMAPEQVTGGAISPATDIFSVGAVMFELFTGRKPFEGESLQTVFYKIVSESPADLATFVPSLPPELNLIVKHALEKDPADRFASAAAMANALTEARALVDPVSSQPKGLSLESAINSSLATRATRPVPPMRRKRPTLVAAAAAVLVISAIGIGGTLWSRRTGDAPASAPTESVVIPPSSPAANPPVAAPSPGGGAKESVSPAGTPTPNKTADRIPPTQTPKTASPTPQELSLFRSLQSSALDVRRRASDAGATADQLRAGDDHNVAATNAIQQGKVTDGANHLNLATTAWAAAERDARALAAVAAAAAKTRVAASDSPKQQPIVATPPVVPPPAPVSAATHPPANPTADIEGVVNAYEKAIESRDIAEVRRTYVGVTPAQASAWEQFFRSVRSVDVRLSMSNLEIRGDTADARLIGAYEFVTTSGKNQHQPTSFQAGFRRDGGVWRLTSVR